MNSTAILQAGATALAQAAQENGLTLSDQARFWVIGKAYAESGLGAINPPSAFAQFDGTNNWGAVYWPSSTQPPNPFSTSFKGGKDSAPGGVPFTSMIAVYPTQVDGAKGMLYVYRKYGDVMPVLADPKSTSYDFARVLYKHGYFGGCHVGRDGAPSLNLGQSFKKRADQLAAMDPSSTVKCVGTRKVSDLLLDTQAAADDANIREYARMIDNGAAQARAAVGAPPVPITPPPPPPPKPPEQPSTGLWWKVPTIAGLVYGGYRFVQAVRKEKLR